MNEPSRRGLVATIALGVFLLGGACASPLWKYDHYVVDGALLGSTCRATIDGRPFVGEAGGLGPKIQFVNDENAPTGRTIIMLVCRGLVLEFATRRGTRPDSGRYRVVSRVVGLDTPSVKVDVSFSGITERRWPFAPTGVHLEGKEGYLQLDEMTDSTARGTFHAIVRRQPNGE